jgi:DNA (cytosine-5)-methyltransferase 1
MVIPTVISTFAGCGGSSLGYHWAGFKELLAIDFDKNSCEVLKANFDFPIWEREITKVSAEEILNFCKIEKGELDILDGSPPCQGFSTAGKRKLTDSRNDLFKDYIRLIDGLQPKVFVMENVSGMMKGRYRGKFNEILSELKNTGYNVKCKLMNAMWYDVPQARERLIFIGARNDLQKYPTFPAHNKIFISVFEALANCPVDDEIKYPTDILNKYVSKMREGEGADKYHPKHHYFNVRKLHHKKPAPTLTKLFMQGAAGLIHYKDYRFITITEAKRICSFPDNFILLGSFEQKWARLGNAVMPKMMYHIAKHIKETILE